MAMITVNGERAKWQTMASAVDKACSLSLVLRQRICIKLSLSGKDSRRNRRTTYIQFIRKEIRAGFTRYKDYGMYDPQNTMDSARIEDNMLSAVGKE